MEMQRMDLTTAQPQPLLSHSFCKRMSSMSVLVLTVLLYQNFTFTDNWKVSLIPLNEKSRSAHARELLGNKYAGSPAQSVENVSALGMAIFNDVYRNLPKKHKSAAVDLAAMIVKEAERYGIDPVFVVAVIKTESSFNPLARGSAGEIGLMQIKPDTAKWIAEKANIPWRGPKTLENPTMNVRIGMAYFNYLRESFDGHANKYVSAYNMGALNVRRKYSSGTTPKEYSTRVMKHYNETYKKLSAATTLNLLAGN
ncbi:MAG: lytic transglycosylase domain-containing protein [Pseudobdellovibrionaceae bacterium]